jgi:Family of unknown function (DUF6152)
VKKMSRRASVIAGAAAIAALAIAIAPAAAHHSFAMYDMSIQKTMTGKLLRYVVGGNHSQFVFQVVNPDGSLAVGSKGEPVTWSVETAAAVALARRGITVEAFKLGTIFTITFSPLRDGRNGGAQREGGLIMCGMKLPEGGCTEKTGKVY